MHGMTVTCPRAGQIWGSGAMRSTLDRLAALGVDWVAIHPYAWIGRDGEVTFRPAADAGYLHRAVALAHDAGMALFWKPHLGYWGSFAWRGDIAFGDDEAAWRRFFDSYRAFIVDQARFAARAHVPLFAVGVELEATMHREADWRRVIAAVRAVYPGRLIYAANWDGIARVPFWDALDLIGVQAYFPLSEAAAPSPSDLIGGWQRHLEPLRRLSARHGGKRVVFTEIGYNRSVLAARQPWDDQVQDSAAGRALRRKLIEVALAVTEHDPLFAGLFWWKWMPGSARGSNFSMRDAEALEALGRAWGKTATELRPAGE